MADQDKKIIGRRDFMRFAGVSVVAGSLTGLTACGGGDSSSSSSAPAPKADPAPAPKPVEAAPAPAPAPAPVAEAPAPAPAAAPSGDAARVSEDDPVASSLGYKHNAAEVDLAKHPRRGEAASANHYCKNCVLFQGNDGDEWGPCSIFGGKLVNAQGWCATYAPKG
ncbi:MAG: high-potential iron-sulfur protein [Gammaproteobacteria bacterium]